MVPLPIPPTILRGQRLSPLRKKGGISLRVFEEKRSVFDNIVSKDASKPVAAFQDTNV